jgi:GNAT superfamily N-acetyltransferase
MTDGHFHNLVWNALHTVHAHFAVSRGTSVRYPADVVPLAALGDSTHSDLSPLEDLLAPDERVYLIGPQPQPTRKLHVGPPLHCFQMLFPLPPPSETNASEVQILRMTPEDAPAMVALTDLAFPGFFRPRTNEMGAYYGIRVNGELLAMAGERLAVPGLSEISAVCTHPAHTGKGYARLLMNRLLNDHAKAGLKSFLHVSKTNARAAAIYDRMGFVVSNSASLWPVSRSS